MIRLVGILAFAFGIAGCVVAQPPPYGYGDPYFAPRPSFGIGIGAGSFGGGGFGGVGVGVGF